MGRFRRALRWWFGVPVVLSSTAVGYLTNLVTSGLASWPIVAGLGTAVAAMVGLTVRQAAVVEKQERAVLREGRALNAREMMLFG